MRFLFSFFSPPHRFYVSLPPRRKDEDTQRSNFNRKIVNRKIVNITMILFFRTPSKSVIAVECNHELPQADSDKLCWLFGEATPESEDNLKGHFVGPRREMITPWSTNAVEITQNMGLDGIIRIEEYFPVKDENADHDPMLQRMYKGLDQNVFTTNRQPEPIVHIEDLEAYNEKEGLALSKEEMDYLKKVEKDLGRPLTDSEVFGFAQINSEHCRHKIFGGTFIIDGVEQESSLFQMIKKTTQENPNKIISAYKDNVAFAEGPVIEQFAPADHSKPDYFQVKDIKSVISLKAETHNFPTTVEPFNGASTGTGGEIRDRMGGGKGSWPIAGTAVYMTSYPRTEEGRPWEEILPVRKWLYQTPEQILIKASNGASDFGNKFGQPLICGSVLTFEHKEKEEVYGYDKVIMLAGGVGYGTQRDCLKGTPEAGNKVVVIGGYLGLVFQLQDDYLDVYGDVEEFGKKIGGDILCNKKTYLLIKAFELASEEDKALLKEWVVKEKFNPQEKIKEVTEIYNRSGVKEVLRAKVDDYLEKSRIALDKIEVPEERKVRFYEMIDFIGKRKK